MTDNTLVQLSIHCPRLQALVNLHCAWFCTRFCKHMSFYLCSCMTLNPVCCSRDSPCHIASWSQMMASELWAAVPVAKSASLWWSWTTAPSSLMWHWSTWRAATGWNALSSTTVSKSPALASNASGLVEKAVVRIRSSLGSVTYWDHFCSVMCDLVLSQKHKL